MYTVAQLPQNIKSYPFQSAKSGIAPLQYRSSLHISCYKKLRMSIASCSSREINRLAIFFDVSSAA